MNWTENRSKVWCQTEPEPDTCCFILQCLWVTLIQSCSLAISHPYAVSHPHTACRLHLCTVCGLHPRTVAGCTAPSCSHADSLFYHLPPLCHLTVLHHHAILHLCTACRLHLHQGISFLLLAIPSMSQGRSYNTSCQSIPPNISVPPCPAPQVCTCSDTPHAHTHIHSHPGSLVAACRLRTRPLAVAPLVCPSPLATSATRCIQ